MNDSEYRWLEDIEGTDSLEWVEQQNVLTLAQLQNDHRYKVYRDRALSYYTDANRIPYGNHVGGRVFNFWQDDTHIKGILREASLEEYATDNPKWSLLLDIDQLSEEEGEDWVYKEKTNLPFDSDRCLIHLSRGGGDAAEIREFDLAQRQFVTDGFSLPEAKSYVAWLDKDHLLVATDYGPNTLTTSGYPRIVKKWRRGTSLSAAEEIIQISENETQIVPVTKHRSEGSYTFLLRLPDFFRQEIYLLESNNLKKVPIPATIEFYGILGEFLLFQLRNDWIVNDEEFSTGELVCIKLHESIESGEPIDPQLVFAPQPSMAIKSTVLGRDAAYVSMMEDVDGKLIEVRPAVDGSWEQKEIDLPAKGTIEIVSNDAVDDLLMLSFQSFLTPPSLFMLHQGAAPEILKSEPPRFDSTNIRTDQFFADSKDGTRIPYYIVSNSDLTYDGEAPTIVYGYGGFEIPVTPAYLAPLSSEWLAAGGVYVMACIRGGGEYGPKWHQSAILQDRQNAFDDFIAVSEDLVARNITSPAKLGIRGGSNGGLLVTAVMVQRPDLFNAVVCAIPLIDMLRYHKLSAGASWMSEYGNPDIPEEAEIIRKYSPFQNVNEVAQYPEVFFWTNMKDDRVHPSHARRMAAKMQSQGHRVLYYEDAEGGHGGGADPSALAHTTALEIVYFMQKLMD